MLIKSVNAKKKQNRDRVVELDWNFVKG